MGTTVAEFVIYNPAMKFWTLLLVLLLPQAPAPEVEITAEPHHHQVFSNDQVRVFTVEVGPHSETQMHWHRHDYVYITLGPSQVVSAVKGKDPVTAKLNDGDTYFLPATFAHIARNLADTPFRNVTIELLQDEKLRKLPKPADDRGLEILEGGTQQILWIKDGVRASEFELQPKGTGPLPKGECLLVAVSDLRLEHAGVHGSGPRGLSPDVPLISGHMLWLNATAPYAVTNTGNGTAKFVILEFPATK